MICQGCNVDKWIDEFYWRDKAKTVKQNYCKSCKSKYNKSWYKNNKLKHTADVAKNKAIYVKLAKDYVNELKSKPCTDCGQSYPPYVMDFDHIVPGKEYDIAKMVSIGCSLRSIKQELTKCELVCSNCHRVRTFTRFGAEDSAGIS